MIAAAKLPVLPILISTSMATQGGDRDWWRSDAGKVTEHHDRQGITCTLLMKSDQGEFRFMWSSRLPPRAIVERPNWNLPPGLMWTVSLRIGSVWIGDGNGAANIPALTGQHSLKFLLGQPILDLLNAARSVTLQTPDRSFEMIVPRSKMRALVTALRRCTALIGHGPGH